MRRRRGRGPAARLPARRRARATRIVGGRRPWRRIDNTAPRPVAAAAVTIAIAIPIPVTVPIPVAMARTAPMTMAVIVIRIVVAAGAAPIRKVEIIASRRPPGAVAPVPRPRRRIIGAAGGAIGIAVIGVGETAVRAGFAIGVTGRVCPDPTARFLTIAVTGPGFGVTGVKG